MVSLGVSCPVVGDVQGCSSLVEGLGEGVGVGWGMFVAGVQVCQISIEVPLGMLLPCDGVSGLEVVIIVVKEV